MAIQLECACGRALRVRDEYTGRQVRCPDCGEVLVVSDANGKAAEELPSTETRTNAAQDIQEAGPDSDRHRVDWSTLSTPESDTPIATISGRPATFRAGTIEPSLFGSTTLQLKRTRLISDSKRIVHRTHSQILLSEIDSAEIVTSGNPIFLVLGVPLIALHGLGLLLLAAWFFLKYRFMVFRSGSNAHAVTTRGATEPYEQFLLATLDAAEKPRPRDSR